MHHQYHVPSKLVRIIILLYNFSTSAECINYYAIFPYNDERFWRTFSHYLHLFVCIFIISVFLPSLHFTNVVCFFFFDICDQLSLCHKLPTMLWMFFCKTTSRHVAALFSYCLIVQDSYNTPKLVQCNMQELLFLSFNEKEWLHKVKSYSNSKDLWNI